MWEKQISELRDKAIRARIEAQRAEAQRYNELLQLAAQYEERPTSSNGFAARID
jgi:hypothetical protein